MTPEALRARIDDAPVLLDGGLATQLESVGRDISGSLWSATVLRDDPLAVRDAHLAFLKVGADVIITASYQVSRRGLVAAGGTAAEADSLLARSVELALEARESFPQALVAASVGPYGATNHDGSEYRGRYGLSRRDLADFHRERLGVLVAAGADLLAIETIPDLDEVEALVEALEDVPGVAAWLSMTTPDGTVLSAGQPLAEAAQVVAGCSSVVAVGVNCSAPRTVGLALSALAEPWALAGGVGAPALLAYPNAGQVWDSATETWSGPLSPVPAATDVDSWLSAGARLLGACCGVQPADIASLSALMGRSGWHSD